MQIRQIAFCFFVISTFFLSGQCPSTILLRRQSQVDSFPILYPNCQEVFGSVIISQASGSEIVNLDSLIQLKTVTGRILINTNSLVDLHGLDSISYARYFDIYVSSKLQNFNGLSSLSEVDSLIIRGGTLSPDDFTGFEKLEIVNRNLKINFGTFTSLKGFSNLKKVNGTIQLDTIPLLSLDGFANLDTVADYFTISRLHRLKDLQGLKSLKHSFVDIWRNDSLLNLRGLDSLRSAVFVWVGSNKRLQSLEGLENLDSIIGNQTLKGGIDLLDNPELFDLDALNHFIALEDIRIIENPKLSICHVEAVCKTIQLPSQDTTQIYDNGSGCNGVNEILNQCINSVLSHGETHGYKILPNPTICNQDFYLEINSNHLGKLELIISSIDGGIIQKHKRNNLQSFERIQFPAPKSTGIYTVQIFTEFDSWVGKIIVVE